jgi:outer membrane protein TolC
MRRFLLAALLPVSLFAENHVLTLSEAVARAIAQNPDVVMARLEAAKAAAGVTVTNDPFTPHLYAGSGLAYNSGFPLSIEGSAPAVVQAKANQSLFNRPQSYAVAQARENARAATLGASERGDEIAFRVASLFLEARRSSRLAASAKPQIENLSQVLEAVSTRVEAGRELPIAKQEAQLNLLRARQRLMSLDSSVDSARHNLAAVLGFPAADTVEPASEETPTSAAALPDTEDAALATALSRNAELKRLESNYQAKALEIKGDRAQRLPRVELVAQYALLTRYSHYDEYFNKFQRHNGEVGASIQIPILGGSALKALVAQAEVDQQHIRAEIQATRNRIALDLHDAYQEIAKSQMASEVAKADLDLAHEQLSVLLSQMNEGRASLRQVEEARFSENEKWIAFYDAQFNVEKARLGVLRQTGALTATAVTPSFDPPHSLTLTPGAAAKRPAVSDR